MKRTNNAIAIAAAVLLLIAGLSLAWQHGERVNPERVER